MRRNEATAFENEYFYDKKGKLKVRKVPKGTAKPRPMPPKQPTNQIGNETISRNRGMGARRRSGPPCGCQKCRADPGWQHRQRSRTRTSRHLTNTTRPSKKRIPEDAGGTGQDPDYDSQHLEYGQSPGWDLQDEEAVN